MRGRPILAFCKYGLFFFTLRKNWFGQNWSSQTTSVGPEMVKPVNVSTGPETNYVVHKLMGITIFTCIKLADLGYPRLYLSCGD